MDNKLHAVGAKAKNPGNEMNAGSVKLDKENLPDKNEGMDTESEFSVIETWREQG